MKTTVKKRTITLGTDVEGTLYHGEKRQYIPATDFNTPYTKDKRKFWENDEGSYHRDNILVEFQTPVVTTWSQLKTAVVRCNKHLQQVYAPLGCTVQYRPVTKFKEAGMVKIPEAMEIGCDPDYCAYTGKKMDGPDAGTMGQLRPASGHIHMGGLEDLSFEQQCILVRWLDVTLGLTLTSDEADNGMDTEKRREWYGQAGRFRPKPYGIEYRTPSNLWVQQVLKGRRKFVHMDSLIRDSIDLTDMGKMPEDYGINGADIASAINGSQVFLDGDREDWYNHIYRVSQNVRDGLYKARQDV